MKDKLIVVLAAAGVGKRLGLGKNKAFVFLAGAPIMAHNLRQLSQLKELDRVIIVVRPNEFEEATLLLQRFQAEYYPRLRWSLAAGGAERQDSVYNALLTIEETEGFVAIHDGARPFATAAVFKRVWNAAIKTGAAIAAVPVKDTIKSVTTSEMVSTTPARACLRAVQTPQIFSLPLIRAAYEKLRAEGIMVTDDAGAVERLGVQVAVAEGSYDNNKITTPEDLVWAESLLRCQGGNVEMIQMRVGCGFDVHCLVSGRKLILCGVEIPYELGLEGHSDADVALHALMDAMLGAAGLGDIGLHFPDTDAAFKDADSMMLLRHVVKLTEDAGWRVGNADITIIAQKPKLAPYREEMVRRVNQELALEVGALNIKATTTEHLGFTGRGEGIAAQAVVTLFHTK